MRLSSYSGRGVSAGAVIAVCGVAIALTIMELTLSIVMGFKHQITQKVIGFDAQLTIGMPYDYSSGAVVDYVTFTPELKAVVADFSPAHRPSLAMQLPAMIKTDDDFAGMLYVGHDDAYAYDFEKNNLIDGVFPDFSQNVNEQSIVISKQTADALGLAVGSRVYSCFFVDGALKTRRHDVAGIYESNLGEYDRVIVYASLSALQKIAGIDAGSGTRIEYSGFALDSIEPAAIDLQERLSHAVQTGKLDELYPVSTVLRTGAVYFNWLSLLDTNVIVIFILMICVAAFTLVSSLFIIVLDRVGFIGVLRSLGASRSLVVRIFLHLGMRMTAIGVMIGNVFGIGLSMLQSVTHAVRLDPDMYYLRHVPVEIDPLAFVCINIGVFVIAWAVLYIPARAASRIDPTATMRYE